MHEIPLATLNEVLHSGVPVVVRGAPGTGKSTVATAGARAFAAQSGRTVRRLSASRAGQRVLTQAPEAFANQILVIENAHHLCEADNDALESLVRHHPDSVSIILTSHPTGSATIRRLRREQALSELTMNALPDKAAHALINSITKPARFEAESVASLQSQSAGNPLILSTIVAALVEQASTNDTLTWDGVSLPRQVPLGLAEALLGDLSNGGAAAAHASALLHPALATDIAQLTSDDALNELLDSGLADVTHDRVVLLAPLAASIIRASIAADRAREMFITAVPGLLPFWWALPADQRDSILALSVRCGEHLPLSLILHQHGPTDHPASFARAASWASAIVAHPEASDSDRLIALAIRIDGYRWSGNRDAGNLDAERSQALAPHATPEARVVNLSARARFLHYSVGDHQAALDLVRDESAAIRAAGAVEPAIATQLDLIHATIAGYAGYSADAFRSLTHIIDTSGIHANTLIGIAPLAMLAAQRGEHTVARRLLNKAFPIAIFNAKKQPAAPGEIVVASFFADVLGGRIASATRTQKRINASLAKDRHRLPAHDIAQSRMGVAMLHIANGSWSQAVAEYESALQRYGERDPYGQRPYFLAQYALALAATGDHDKAEAVSHEANESVTGTSRVAARYIDIHIITARLWCDHDVRASAIRLADQCREDELSLMELRALHILSMIDGANLDPAILQRVFELATTISSPVAVPLASHIRDLSQGVNRLESEHARALARHGIIVPIRGRASELTAREREVAISASLGYSTKSIAAQLGNSKRTIDAHLNRIFIKLGIDAREDLARVLSETNSDLNR